MAKKKSSGKFLGHIAALVTVIVWGVTFIATEQMLDLFSNSQLLMIRFVIAYVVLFIARPHFLPIERIRNEIEYIIISAAGVLGYHALGNYAIDYGGAENASILISFAPIVTLMIMCITGYKEKLKFHHFLGFLIAIGGVVLVVYNGTKLQMTLNMKTVLAALGACVCWGIYSVIISKHTERDAILLARRMLFWSVVFIVPFTLLTDGMPPIKASANLTGVICLVLLGVLGSGFCYSMWNSSVRHLGVDVTTNYIYLSPFVTLLASLLMNRANISWIGFAGAGLILVGVIISDIK